MTEQRYELSLERHIAAPVEQVWHVMVDRFEEWFCPAPWRAEVRELDWRPGGRSLIVMHGPDGEAIPNEGTVLAFEPNRRFVFTDAFKGDWQPAGPFMVAVFEIAADDGGTRYRASARHWTREAMEQHKTMGFEPGWGVCADQLKSLAEA